MERAHNREQAAAWVKGPTRSNFRKDVQRPKIAFITLAKALRDFLRSS